ncbi:protein yellow-like [Bacillus rossius redtenbacheri]|uniref:protein yellow-like n=1 Tax=Bacillus rossius redtenbacheri TaxID=93214 RepID=UPI002FDD6DBC
MALRVAAVVWLATLAGAGLPEGEPAVEVSRVTRGSLYADGGAVASYHLGGGGGGGGGELVVPYNLGGGGGELVVPYNLGGGGPVAPYNLGGGELVVPYNLGSGGGGGGCGGGGCRGGGHAAQKLIEVFSWKHLDYEYPSKEARQRALANGDFKPPNCLPVGIEVWCDKMFVTVPRWESGVPSTLNYVSLSSSPSDGPLLVPYPSWEFNREGNCAGVTTTYRIKVDKCDRLWVLDTGTVGIENTTRQLCPYSLMAFDLHSDRLLRRYTFKDSDTNANTFIANIAVDVGCSCDDTFVYASDELGYGLIVYSFQQDDSWRVTHGYFHPDPLCGDFDIGGLNFQWEAEGVFGMALSPPAKDCHRTLFFHPLASHREFAVSTAVLRDRERAMNSYHEFVALDERGPRSHVTASVMDDQGIMFYNLIDRNAVGCWNSRLPYCPNSQGLVDKDDERLIFPSDVKVDADRNLWVMSDRMPNFLLSELDYGDVNFRVFYLPVSEAVKGTVCDPRVAIALQQPRQAFVGDCGRPQLWY